MLIFTLSGYITALLGWSAVFYVTGAASLAWAAAWFLLVADTPASHPHITPQERHLIGGIPLQNVELSPDYLQEYSLITDIFPLLQSAACVWMPSWTGSGWSPPGARSSPRLQSGASCWATPPVTGATIPS